MKTDFMEQPSEQVEATAVISETASENRLLLFVRPARLFDWQILKLCGMALWAPRRRSMTLKSNECPWSMKMAIHDRVTRFRPLSPIYSTMKGSKSSEKASF